MAKFCKKCGSFLDVSTGLCPQCINENTNIKAEKAEKTKGNCEKKENGKKLSFRKRIKRFFFKVLVVILTLGLVGGSCACALVYFDLVDIPFVESVMSFFEFGKNSNDADETEENAEEIALESIVITDAESALQYIRNSTNDSEFKNSTDELTLKKQTKVKNITYYRFQQNYKGIPAYGKQYIIAVSADGKVLSQNTNTADVPEGFSIMPTVTVEAIVENLKNYLFSSALINNKADANSTESEEHSVEYSNIEEINITNLNDKDLYIFFGSDNEEARLVYILKLDATKEFSSYRCIADAHSGEIVSVFSDTVMSETPTIGYNSDGTESFPAVLVNDDGEKYYRLADMDRNILIGNLEGQNSKQDIWDENLNKEYIDSSDAYFGNNEKSSKYDEEDQERALDFYKHVMTSYDYFANTGGINDTGFERGLWAFFDDAYDNGENGYATAATYDDGSGIGVIVLGTETYNDIDTVAHEYTHTITRNIVDWNNRPKNEECEWGAIDEAYSDIFSTIINAKTNNLEVPTWNNTYRNIADPGESDLPSKISEIDYKASWYTEGEKYISGQDYSHGASTVISHAAYLMSNGVNGQYTALDIDTLALLWYNTLHLLPPDCSFVVLRASMEATAKMLGLPDELYDCICAAFDEVEIFWERKTNKEVVLVLDASGSMSGDPINQTKFAAISFAGSMFKEDARVSVVTYSGSAGVSVALTQNATKVNNAINAIGIGGGTNIESGLSVGYSQLENSTAKNRIIVLMSDGMPNAGKTGDSLIAYADEIKNNGITIYTMGFFSQTGNDRASAQALMEKIGSSGNHYEASDTLDLEYFFSDVADQINGQKYTYVRVACPTDVTVTFDGETLCSAAEAYNDRTSFGSLTLEDIENSDNKIKTLRLKADADYDIRIEGTGRGKMDYTIGFMDEDGEYSDMRKFRNIDITRSTVIDTSTVLDEKTVLNVDEDGDGRYDFKFRAGVNEYGELVEYTYILYLSLCIIGLIIISAVVIKTKRKINKRKEN